MRPTHDVGRIQGAVTAFRNGGLIAGPAHKRDFNGGVAPVMFDRNR